MQWKRALWIATGLWMSGCGDNTRPGMQRLISDTSVSGSMVARSQHYRIVATVTAGRLDAATAANAVRTGVAAQRGAR